MTDEQEFSADWFSKPGDSLRALMLRRAVAPQALADRLDGGMATLRGLLDGSSPVDVSHAAALVAALGGTVAFWLKRQANYETALDRAVDRAEAIEADEWLQLPVPGDRPRGRLSPERRRIEVRRRLAFFNIGTMKAWEARYGRVCRETLFRNSNTFTSDDAAVLMWLRSGELGADLVQTRLWSAGNLHDRLDPIRKLSKVKRPELFLPKLRELCAEAGVAVVVKKAPSGCRASGATRMVASDKAMMLLSFRGLSDDKFWFTVFHEIGHLLLHGARTFVDTNMEDSSEIAREDLDESEREANDFAANCIVPERRSEEFHRLRLHRDDVMRFGVSVGVSAGLVVGQLQNRRMIRPDQMNFLKRHWNWQDLAAVMD